MWVWAIFELSTLFSVSATGYCCGKGDHGSDQVWILPSISLKTPVCFPKGPFLMVELRHRLWVLAVEAGCGYYHRKLKNPGKSYIWETGALKDILSCNHQSYSLRHTEHRGFVHRHNRVTWLSHAVAGHTFMCNGCNCGTVFPMN